MKTNQHETIANLTELTEDEQASVAGGVGVREWSCDAVGGVGGVFGGAIASAAWTAAFRVQAPPPVVNAGAALGSATAKNGCLIISAIGGGGSGGGTVTDTYNGDTDTTAY